jgi:hypothetical protein
VAEVDHLRAGCLQDSSHNVDRGIVPVKKRGGGDETNLGRGSHVLRIGKEFRIRGDPVEIAEALASLLLIDGAMVGRW